MTEMITWMVWAMPIFVLEPISDIRFRIREPDSLQPMISWMPNFKVKQDHFECMERSKRIYRSTSRQPLPRQAVCLVSEPRDCLCQIFGPKSRCPWKIKYNYSILYHPIPWILTFQNGHVSQPPVRKTWIGLAEKEDIVLSAASLMLEQPVLASPVHWTRDMGRSWWKLAGFSEWLMDMDPSVW
jgi:hypothetical protein